MISKNKAKILSTYVLDYNDAILYKHWLKLITVALLEGCMHIIAKTHYVQLVYMDIEPSTEHG